jgi:hypothetical protein
MVLTVPPLKENLNDARAREVVNRRVLEAAVFEEQQGRRRTASRMRDLAG